MALLLQIRDELGPLDRSTDTNVLLDLTRKTADMKEPHNPDPVSHEVKEMFRIVLYVSICGILSLFGIGANVTNIVVFIRQGFKDSINISLLGLAVADLGCALTMFWMSVGFSPLLASPDLRFNPFDVVYLSGGWPHACFNRVTSLITAFMTLERCLCVATPLKVKDIITPFRTKVIILFIFTLMIGLFTPFYFVNHLVWAYNLLRNTTILSLVYSEDRIIVETITFPIHSVMLPVVCLLSVIIFTIILITELNKKQKWRHTSTSVSAKSETVSAKEKKVEKMVILISIIFIICYTPPTVNFFLMAYNPEFSFSGKYVNVFFVVWSLTALVQTVSFSVNIFVYFFMSSKFKTTLLKTVCRK